MDSPSIVDRLTALPDLAGIPRAEMEWLVRHGRLESGQAGDVIAPKGVPVEDLWVLLSGSVAVHVDRGTGPRRVIVWKAGEVSGMLPYSRMEAPPGDNVLEEPTEYLSIPVVRFPEMVRVCPNFTAYTVHIMLDRARRFNASALQDEKMISLGKLSAGLAHELNNPAAATVRAASLLPEALEEADRVSREVGAAGFTPEEVEAIEGLRGRMGVSRSDSVLSPIERADREDAIADWLDRHDCDPEYASALAETTATLEELDGVAAAVAGERRATAIRWIAVGGSACALATDIQRAATRIHDLVAAVKRFTYMDNLAGPESVDVAAGIRDTIAVLTSKAKSRGAKVALTVDGDVPNALATGGELNQVWLNLIDNALDAIEPEGRVDVHVSSEADRIVVRVTDDGAGIPPEVLPMIFDPFFTTKPTGQGTGLGLDITRRLLRQYKGDLTVDSRPGRTEFRASLPAVPA
jgi:signal transduction histidine kinase